jgi:hypothetical protein
VVSAGASIVHEFSAKIKTKAIIEEIVIFSFIILPFVFVYKKPMRPISIAMNEIWYKNTPNIVRLKKANTVQKITSIENTSDSTKSLQS